MKIISEHLGEIIVALIGVSILVGVCVLFKEPLSGFFTDVITSLTTIGTNIVNGIPTAMPAPPAVV